MSYQDRRKAHHRLIPIWKSALDREAFAKALLLLAMHLDETQKKPHIQAHDIDDNEVAKDKGGGGSHGK